MNNLGNKPLIVMIGLIASMISIYVFVTGRPSLKEAYPPSSALVENFVQAPAAAQANNVSQEQPAEYSANPLSEPLLAFTPCVTFDECPDAISIYTALGEPESYDYDVNYSIEAERDLFIRFSTGWCTKDQTLLDDHVPHLKAIFAINGVSYKQELTEEYGTRPTEEDAAIDMYCYHFGTGISNWEPGVTYRINFGFIMDTDLYDGWENFPKGDYIHTYFITGK